MNMMICAQHTVGAQLNELDSSVFLVSDDKDQIFFIVSAVVISVYLCSKLCQRDQWYAWSKISSMLTFVLILFVTRVMM